MFGTVRFHDGPEFDCTQTWVAAHIPIACMLIGRDMYM